MGLQVKGRGDGDTYRVVGVKNVGGGGVVHDDDLGEVAAQAAQVLHVVAPVEDAGLAEQTAAERPPLVQEVGDGVGVLRQQTRRSMHDASEGGGAGLTLAKLAVKRTHSNSSPILFRNSSTWGRFSTYTYGTGARLTAPPGFARSMLHRFQALRTNSALPWLFFQLPVASAAAGSVPEPSRPE